MRSKRKVQAHPDRQRAIEIYTLLSAAYPNVTTFLTHQSTFQLLIAVILSAQCTDARVNMVTPGLFAVFPTAELLAGADVDEVRGLISSVNFCNAKAINIIKTAQKIMSEYEGEVPQAMEALITLPGVGRKTANVVRGQAFGLPGITVDTHVKRLANRMGFVNHKDPTIIETQLSQVWDPSIWSDFSTQLIVHGRSVCTARSPRCGECLVGHLCPADGVR